MRLIYRSRGCGALDGECWHHGRWVLDLSLMFDLGCWNGTMVSVWWRVAGGRASESSMRKCDSWHFSLEPAWPILVPMYHPHTTQWSKIE